MGVSNFHAIVQYGDWKGTASADDHDNTGLRNYLERENLINEGELLIGIEMWSGEVHAPTQEDEIYVRALLATDEGYDNISAAVESGNPLKVREVELRLKLNVFFGLFKRFAISISNHGIIDGLDIEIT